MSPKKSTTNLTKQEVPGRTIGPFQLWLGLATTITVMILLLLLGEDSMGRPLPSTGVLFMTFAVAWIAPGAFAFLLWRRLKKEGYKGIPIR